MPAQVFLKPFPQRHQDQTILILKKRIIKKVLFSAQYDVFFEFILQENHFTLR